MIKKALEYIVGLGKPYIQEIKGVTYSDKEMTAVEQMKYYARPFTVNTLSSFVDYISSNKDGIDYSKAIVHIVNYDEITMFSSLDEYKNRDNYIVCKADVPKFNFDVFYSADDFNIKIQSLFCDAGDKAKILKLAGNIKSENVNTASDDGTTQIVQTKKGIILGEDEFVPNPVSLAPFRTFTEINQPVSKFIFRVENGPKMALFEADGGKWKLTAIQRIKDYLQEEFSKIDNSGIQKITILA